MITILNKGSVRDSGIAGWHKYELSIGQQVVAKFEHQRIDGLAKCLRAAADAIDKKQEKTIGRLVDKTLLKKHQKEDELLTGKTPRSKKRKGDTGKDG